MANVIIPMDLLDSNTDVQNLALNAVIKGASNKPLGDSVCYHIFNKKLDLTAAKFLYSVGATIDDYQLFIKINDPQDLVPEALIGSKRKNEDDEEYVVKWNEWLKTNSTISDIDGEYFVPTDGFNGTPLTFSELAPVFNDLVHPNDLPKPSGSLEPPLV